MRRFFELCESPSRSLRGKSAALAIVLLCTACSTTPPSGFTFFYNWAESLKGYQGGLVGIAGPVSGAQTHFFYSEAEDLSGFQLAGLPGNRAVNVSGVQFSAINIAEERVDGHQLAFIVNETRELSGGQFAGIYNKAERGAGYQISSLVNVADDLRGFQLGALNFNRNGFLPFFPVFNFGFGSEREDEAASED